MARAERFTTADKAEIRNRGLSVEEAERQLRLFEQLPPVEGVGTLVAAADLPCYAPFATKVPPAPGCFLWI